MTAERLPPEGYELGPGWKVAGLRGGHCYVNERGTAVSPDEAETMGAIVRKAEALASRATNGRFGFAPDRICKCGHDFSVHVEGEGYRCDEPSDQSCSCRQFEPAGAPTFEQTLSGATAALGVIGTGILHETLVTEGPRTYAVTAEAPTSLVCMAETPRGVCAMRKGHGGEHDLFFASTVPAEAPTKEKLLLPPSGFVLNGRWKVCDPGAKPAHEPRRRCSHSGCKAHASYRLRFSSNAACREHAEVEGAIVRKPEAPKAIAGQPGAELPADDVCERAGHEFSIPSSAKEDGSDECVQCGIMREDAEAPPEQPSGNPGELPAEATFHPPCAIPGCDHEEVPAAPVAEPAEARHLAHAFVVANRLDCEKERPCLDPRPDHFPLCDRLTDVIQRAIDPRDARISALADENRLALIRIAALEVAIKAMTVNFGRIYDGPSVCAENYGLVDRLRGIYKKPGGERRFAVAPIHKEAADRISALEAEVAARLVERDGWMEAAARSEREKAALQAELAEATSHVNDVAEAYRRTLAAWEAKYVESFTMLAEANAACVAAVQAERDRCAATLDEWLAGRIGRLSECRQKIGDGTPIKNGDPAP